MGDVQVANLVTIKFSKSEPEAEEYTTHKARLFSTLFRLSIVTPTKFSTHSWSSRDVSGIRTLFPLDRKALRMRA